MPVEVFQDEMELTVPVLEVAGPGGRSPFPILADTGRVVVRTFATVVLENSFLKLHIVPDLGGRILSIVDKRSNRELIALPDVLSVAPGGVQGVELPYGLEFSWADASRGGSMDRVAFHVDEAAGAVLISESGADGRSWHLRISIPAERPAIAFEGRALNRTMGGLSMNAGLICRSGQDRGEWPFAPYLVVEAPFDRSQGLNASGRRFDGARRTLSPRQVDEWSAILVPLQKGGPTTACSDGVAVDVANGEVIVEGSGPALATVLVRHAGNTLEAETRLYPEVPAGLSLGNLDADAVAVLIDDVERVHWPRRVDSLELGEPRVLADANTDVSVLDPAVRHLAHLQRAIRAAGDRDYGKADRELERALLFNAEDHLLWWAKAACRRHLGDLETGELENAHYLAPLEPVLRGEALLRQDPSESDGPNLLLQALESHPDELVDMCALYVEHGFLPDAARLIAACLDVADLRSLRYLLAYCMIEGAGMEAEAAVQVRAAASSVVDPPPWRAIERTALQRLADRLPDPTLLEVLRAIP